MKEYTLATFASVLCVIILDQVLRTKLVKQKKFWYFHIVVFFLACIVDNVISGRPYVFFNSSHIIGVRIGFVPIENFFFGFSLITLNLILFEYWKRRTS